MAAEKTTEETLRKAGDPMLKLGSVVAAKMSGMSGMYEEVEKAKKEEEEKAEKAEEKKEDEPTAPPPPRRPHRLPDIPQLERRNWLIHYHVVRRELDTAKELIQEALEETNFGSEYPLNVRALIQRLEGGVEESYEALKQCALLSPSNPVYVKQIARSLFLLGRHDAAIEVFEEAERLDGFDADIYHWKGHCYFAMKDYSKAKEVLKLGIKLHRRDTTLALLGQVLEAENDPLSAIEAYKAAIEVNPENCELHTNLGQLYLKGGSQAQAFESLGRALSLNPSYSPAIIAAGSIIQEHGDYDVALTKYRVAAAELPDSPQLWTNVAMCFYAKKKYVAAISCLKRANYLAPFDWKILYDLGVVHIGMEQYASAFHFLSAALNLNPKVPLLYMSLAVTLTHLEDFKNARLAYEQATAIDKRDPTIALNFAIFLVKRGEAKIGREWFSQYESRLPGLRDPKTGVLRIDQKVIEMAEKLRSVLDHGDVPDAPRKAPQTASTILSASFPHSPSSSKEREASASGKEAEARASAKENEANASAKEAEANEYRPTTQDDPSRTKEEEANS